MDLKRRDFLKLIGATTVATSVPGCFPKEPKKLIPYVIPAEEIIPGRSVWYASVCRECPAGCGISVRVREGRATKVEGNPLHPVNKGTLCARGQASLQGMYNPDRIQSPMRKKSDGTWEELSWEKAEEFLLAQLAEIQQKGRGKDIAWTTPHITGSLDTLVDDWLAAVGSNRRYRYEPFGHEALKRANEFTFGVAEIPTYDFENVDTVFSFGADFLETWLSPVGFANQFSQLRGYEHKKRNKFIYIGPRLSMTAASADEWLDVHPDMLGTLALGLVNTIISSGLAARLPSNELARISSLVHDYTPEKIAASVGVFSERIKELAKMFASSTRSLAVAGGPIIEGEFGVQTIAAVNLLNYVCGNIGKTVKFDQPNTLSRLSSYASVLALVDSMKSNEISALFLNDVNPVFSMPASVGFAEVLSKVPLVVSCSSFMDETTSHATLVLPIHTALESWGDHEPSKGVHGLMQPVMQPVFKTKMLGDILLEIGKKLSTGSQFSSPSFHEYVKNEWRQIHKRVGGSRDFEAFWVESLARGGVWESTASREVKLSSTLTASDIAGPKDARASGENFTLLTYPSISYYDGRGANKPWLQELPDPMTRLVWGSWIEISPLDAEKLGIQNGDKIQVTSPHAKYELPAYVHKGLRSGFVAIPIGQGHTEFGRYASNVGVNPIDLLDLKLSLDKSGGMLWLGAKVEILKLSGKLPLASVQEEESEHGRNIVQEVLLADVEKGIEHEEHAEPSIYPEQVYPKHQWGMVIDVDKCNGCSACVTACYAENNIPVVGAEEVMNGREMAWIRIDRYFDDIVPTLFPGSLQERKAKFLPMLCQQCGSAPCETVCPVYAAYHTEEGLNGQVYNRCIGTRYCANNCPYKVRRFNWFAHDWPEPLNWQLNPDVTVRSKGVMEKCTFCVQRISEGKNNARMEHRNVNDGEIVPACAQSCPAEAIAFGDLKDPESRVSQLAEKDHTRPYHVLHELNTLPAITYLRKIKM